ncbi:MAG TPA: phage holin family protein [Burkholderiales bacterium]|nr:phage holin family protein [Burkholderiales bacterium]
MAAVLPPPERPAPRARAPGVGQLLGRLLAETRQLFADFAHLAVLDARRAALRLAMLLSAGLIIAVLLITAWMGIVAAGIVWMFDRGVSWPLAIAIAALVNIVAAALLGWWARHLISEMPFTALLRQLRGEPPGPTDEKH